MGKIRVVPFNKEQQRLAKILGRYYNAADRSQIEQIRIDIFYPQRNLQERKATFERYKSTILALKPIFKKLVIERNKLARDRGYRNYFEFIVSLEGVPEDKLGLFFNKVDRVIKNIDRKLPVPPKAISWYWSEFNIPAPLDLVHAPKYSIPEDVYKIIGKMNPSLKKIFPKISIKERENFYPRTLFNKETKTVTIEISQKPSIYNALSFAHEFGHAVAILKTLARNQDPLRKNRYQQERDAIKFELEFQKFLPTSVRNAAKGGILGDFVATLFEYEIYNDPQQNFDEAFAKVTNRCYLHANRKTDPFYVLDNHFIDRPCGTIVTSVVETDLLLQEKS